MFWKKQCLISLLSLLFLTNALSVEPTKGQEFIFAEAGGLPGRIFSFQLSNTITHWRRATINSDRVVPRIQSLTWLSDGSIAFCSGLDRSVFVVGSAGERELHYGGGLVRQVRTDTNGDLYWSGLETPIENNPLPDGFVYRRRADNGQIETLFTFSQELVHRDWWGAFDVRDGRVYVATLSSPSKIFELQNSIPRLISTLPISAKSFRFENSTAVLATDGNGKLYRFSDLSQPENFQVAVDSSINFVDFAKSPVSTGRP